MPSDCNYNSLEEAFADEFQNSVETCEDIFHTFLSYFPDLLDSFLLILCVLDLSPSKTYETF